MITTKKRANALFFLLQRNFVEQIKNVPGIRSQIAFPHAGGRADP
jgi:hypothetical protein